MKKRSRRRLIRPIGILATVMVTSGGLAVVTSGQESGECHAPKQSAEPVEQVAQAAAHLASEQGASGCTSLKRETAFALADYQIIEKRANTFTSNSQEGTVLDIDSKGNLLVVWGSRRQEQGSYGIFAQRFDPLGRPLGTEIRVNEFVPNNQEDPAVAFAGNDNAYITWMSFNQDTYGATAEHPGQGEIYARRFSTSCCGTFGPAGAEFRINESVRGHQESPAVAVNGDGQALFTWTTNIDGKQLVMGRIFAADATPLTGEFKLSSGSATLFKDKLASAVSLPDGRFATVWARTDPAGDPLGLYARIINPDGTPATDELLVNAADGKVHLEPSIDVDASGRFVIAWMTQRADESYDVLARQFAADGTAASTVLVVSAEAVYWKSGVAVAVANDGRFAVSWNVHQPKANVLTRKSPPGPATLWARVFAADGECLTAEAFQVNQHDQGRQMLDVGSSARRMAWSELDQLAFAWQGGTEDDYSAVAFTLLAPLTLEAAVPTVIEPLAAAAELRAADAIDPRVLIPPVYDPTTAVPADGVRQMPTGIDFGFVGFTDTGWTPPDPDLAAGPDHVVVAVNGGIRFYEKDGTLTFSETINQFWGPVGAQTFVFDPVCVYDHWSDRFVVGATEHDNGVDYINLAVSDDADPNGVWHKYRFSVNTLGDFVDYPNLGLGPDAIYVAADYFGAPTGNIIHIFDKAKLLNGDPVTLQSVKTSSTQRSLGATNDYDNDGIQYFVTAYSGGNTFLTFDSIRQPLGSPIRNTVNVTVPSFAQPLSVPQKGTTSKLSAIDFRIKHGVVRNGRLWAVHSIGVNGTTRVRWYEFDLQGWPTSGSNPVLLQSGELDYGSGEFTWMADIGVDDLNNAIIAFSRSSANDYAYVARAIRLATDPVGTFQAPETMVDGEGISTSGRWGDYSGVDEDPVEPGTFWTHQEYPGPGTSNWKTWVGQVVVSSGMKLQVDQVVINEVTNLDVTGAGSGTTVYFAYSIRGEGATFVPFLDTTLDLRKPKLIKSKEADAAGNAAIFFTVPSSTPVGIPVWFQAAAYQQTSNFLRFITEQ